MIGNDETALKIYHDTERSFHDAGYRYIGFVSTSTNGKNGIRKNIPQLGSIDQLEKVIDENDIKQVVIALGKIRTNKN